MDRPRLLKICAETGLPKPLFGPGRAVIVVDLVAKDYRNRAPVSPGLEPGEQRKMTAAAFVRWLKLAGIVKPNGQPHLEDAARLLNAKLGTKYIGKDVWKWAKDYRPVPQRVIAFIAASQARPETAKPAD